VQVTTRLSVSGMSDGQRAGLAMFGRRPSWIGVVQSQGSRRVTFAEGGVETAGPSVGSHTTDFVLLRMRVDDEQVQYSYSVDAGKTFTPLGSRAPLLFSWWKAARPALFTYNTNASAPQGGVADFDWVRVEPLGGVLRQ